MKPQCVTTHLKAIEHYSHVELFIMLFLLVLTFKLVTIAVKIIDKTLACAHNSNESYWVALSCGTLYYAVPVLVLTFSKAFD